MNGTAAAVLNAIKYLGDISDDMHLISPVILEPIINLKSNVLSSKNASLSCQEILMALKHLCCNKSYCTICNGKTRSAKRMPSSLNYNFKS
jgi:uncharacterized protein (UPF0371 family)